MEKPWMPGLVDMLQAPPAKEQPKPERPAVTPASPDNLAHEPGSQSAAPAKEREPEHPGAVQSLPAGFADELGRRWAPTTRTPLEFGADTYGNQPWSDRVMEHAPGIAVALLFVAALAALSFFYRVQVGHSLVLLGEKISGQPAQQSAISLSSANATPQPAPPPTQSASSPVQPGPVQPGSTQTGSVEQPISSPNPSPAAANPASAATGAAPAVSVAKNSAPSSNATSNVSPSSTSRPDSAQPSALQSTSQTSTAHGNGQAEFLLAQSALHQARTPEAKARAAQLLWNAVAAGSSDAEIALADLYGRGDGIEKNCLQARILLAAATDKHNPLAPRESAELNIYGCR